MKLLGLRLCEHDSNISYYDGKRVYYAKTERLRQEKHHGYNNLHEWERDIKKLWGITPKEIDQIGIVLDPWHHNLPKDPSNIFPHISYPIFSKKTQILKIDHHYAHALSYWPLTTKSPDVSIVIDGFGDFNIAWTVFKNNQIIDQGFVDQNGSLGMEMCRAGYFLQINSNKYDVAGKLMGLQSYGNLDKEFLESLNLFSLLNIKSLFNFKLWVKHKKDPLLAQLTSLDWINTIHYKIGQILINFFSKYCNTYDTISYSGGVAQNVIWNTLLKQKFPNLIIPPHSNDEGLSLGILEYLRKINNLPQLSLPSFPYSQTDQSPSFLPSSQTLKQVAKFLSQGKVIGWYQGNGEIGPRALGNRSILFNPLIPNGKEIVNQVKQRENYRPFGATVLEEKSNKYFDLISSNPYMLYVAQVKDPRLKCITHIDKTCRVQTVNQDSNPIFYSLIKEFEKLTNIPILLNTSLNVRGKPIASNINNAYELLYNSTLDYLVIGDKIISKT